MTRHLDSTLKRDDWDVLILHYLGLDHIGHVSGPRSPLVRPEKMPLLAFGYETFSKQHKVIMDLFTWTIYTEWFIFNRSWTLLSIIEVTIHLHSGANIQWKQDSMFEVAMNHAQL